MESNAIKYFSGTKNLEKKSSMKEVKLAFLSNFTVDALPDIMKKMCSEKNLHLETYLPPYSQYAQEILNDSSGLYSFSSDIIFILLDVENLFGDLFYFPYRRDAKKREEEIQEKLNEIGGLIRLLKSKTSAKIVFNSLLIPSYSSKGILENKQDNGIRKLVQDFNRTLITFSKEDSQFFVFDFNIFCMKIGLDKLIDQKFSYLADMKISPPALIDLSKEYMGYIYPFMALTKKCIVLDLDNTLWGGVIGESNLGSINLGPEKEGKPFFDFQKRLLELFERGILLAINSKNNYEDAMHVLKNHPYMILKEDHFASMRINWKDKATNMLEIAEELNIGLDSLVFIDDSPTERALIKEMLPEVAVIELPNDPSLYTKTLEEQTLFNTFSTTAEDLKRGEMYITQRKRAELQLSIQNLESFLEQLKIKTTIGEVQEMQVPRISQLTKKTNQFNVTTKRYSEEEITAFMDSPDHIIKFLQVEDKFGDYGITGVVVLKNLNEDEWVIDTLLLSCRILGKNVELALMREIVNTLREKGAKKIRAKFIPTPKNAPAKEFFSECGFVLGSESGEEKNYILEIGSEKIKHFPMEVIQWKH